jgi:site-specific recombinase XerD
VSRQEVIRFAEWLETERYSAFLVDQHVRRLLFVLPRLSRDGRFRVYRNGELDQAFGRECSPQSRLRRFAATRRAYQRFLRSNGRLLPNKTTDRFAALRCRYDQYLVELRGLSISAREHNNATVADFLSRAMAPGEALRTLSHASVERFITLRSKEVSRHSMQHVIAHLRSFLRYCHDQGETRQRLDAIDTPRTYRGELPPRAFRWSEVQALLRSVDLKSKAGRRDYTILHLLAHYGLRPKEIVTLRLDSIDWRAKTLRVEQSKTRSVLVLPLASQTISILRQYLDRNRGWQTEPHPHLFLRVRCPSGPLERFAISDIFEKRTREGACGFASHNVYGLRHTFALQLLKRGVGIKAIGDVLGHRSLECTSVYLRLDVDALRDVAIEVPRVQSRGGRYA